MPVYQFIQAIRQTGGISHSAQHNIRMLTVGSQRPTVKNGAIKFVSWSKSTIKKERFLRGRVKHGNRRGETETWKVAVPPSLIVIEFLQRKGSVCA